MPHTIEKAPGSEPTVGFTAAVAEAGTAKAAEALAQNLSRLIQKMKKDKIEGSDAQRLERRKNEVRRGIVFCVAAANGLSGHKIDIVLDREDGQGTEVVYRYYAPERVLHTNFVEPTGSKINTPMSVEYDAVIDQMFDAVYSNLDRFQEIDFGEIRK